jgi:hypothetical protein
MAWIRRRRAGEAASGELDALIGPRRLSEVPSRASGVSSWSLHRTDPPVPSCTLQVRLRSLACTDPSTLVLKNDSSRQARPLWLDYNGDEVMLLGAAMQPRECMRTP